MSSTSSSDQDLSISSKPWSSGRIMTVTQRERKRQVDRLKQKERRLQTSRLVNDLKAQVDGLTTKLAILGSGPAAMASVDATDAPALSSTESQSVTDSLDTTFQPGLTDMGDDIDKLLRLASPANHDWNSSFPSIRTSQFTTCLGKLLNDTEQVECRGSELSNQLQHYSMAIPLQPSILNSSTILYQQQQTSEQYNELREIPPFTLQNTVNDLMCRAFLIPKQSICTSELLNQDALIRGIVQGWSSVESLPYQCPLWAVIKRIDETLFSYSSVITRFCTLRVTHYVLLYLTGAITEHGLPSFYRLRPSQKRFAHDVAIDVIPWPGVRERAVIDQNFTRSDKFWKELIDLFQFRWPYEVTDAFRLDQKSGLFAFSGLYERHASDIRMWQMHPDFFVSFPDVYDDIIQAEAPPSYMIRPSSHSRVNAEEEDDVETSDDSLQLYT